MTKLYYTAPSDTAFEEMKRECIAQWNTHDNTYGYVDGKVVRIKDIRNVQDNFMYMLAMFDMHGVREVIGRLSEETKKEVKDRMIDGGNDENYLEAVGL